MDFSWIEEVKDLHHDECVEDECEMPRNYISSLFDNLIIILSHNCY